MHIKDIPSYDRPRERMKRLGTGALSDAEILALILQKGTRKESIISVSQKLLAKYPIDKIGNLSINELRSIHGIGEIKAMQLLAAFELQKRIKTGKKSKIKNAKEVFLHFKNKMKNLNQENFIVLMLNTKNDIIKEKTIAIGTLDSVIIHPREIFRDAIKESASAIILVHNHPSGDPAPSPEDIAITEKLANIGEEIGIQILDHVIVGNKYWSWKEQSS
ncbi:MAG TPA: DNA repair protein RadC [Alphaproteobacteria bacterium]|nr:DNA repair protein RadC [Alphaproteobacteria bacterium]